MSKVDHHFRQKNGKGIPSKRNQKVINIVILVYDNTDFKVKASRRERRKLSYSQEKNPPRGNCSSKHLCTKHKGTKVHKKKHYYR